MCLWAWGGVPYHPMLNIQQIKMKWNELLGTMESSPCCGQGSVSFPWRPTQRQLGGASCHRSFRRSTRTTPWTRAWTCVHNTHYLCLTLHGIILHTQLHVCKFIFSEKYIQIQSYCFCHRSLYPSCNISIFYYIWHFFQNENFFGQVKKSISRRTVYDWVCVT